MSVTTELPLRGLAYFNWFTFTVFLYTSLRRGVVLMLWICDYNYATVTLAFFYYDHAIR